MDFIFAPLLIAAAQSATAPVTPRTAVALPERTRTINLRPKLERRRWKEGRDVFYEDANIRLVAEVRNGRVVSVTPVKLTRGALTVSSQQGQASRPCIICYRLDQPLASTCIEVPCFLVPILKPILDRL